MIYTARQSYRPNNFSKKISQVMKNVVKPNCFVAEHLEKIILERTNEDVLNFISKKINFSKDPTLLLSTPKNEKSFKNFSEGEAKTIIDLTPVNYKTNINITFRTINNHLPASGLFIGCFESHKARREKFYKKFPRAIAAPLTIGDFLINRMIPKLNITRGLYQLLTPGRKHFISSAEALGRLKYSGFEVLKHERIGDLSYFIAIKKHAPIRQSTAPSYGLFFKMDRVGKGGKTIGIYKIRTMHPYSEYIQNYVVTLNGYNEIGKPALDFRLTKWGKFIRKLHLDELPQLINVLKGELNIVGVRPLSKFGYEALPLDLQKERIKYKPGCIPPNKALGLSGFEGVIRAERIYLRQLQNKPAYIVNYRYFWMAIFNIIRKKNLSA